MYNIICFLYSPVTRLTCQFKEIAMSPYEIQWPLALRWLCISEFPDQSTFREEGVNRYKGELAHSFMMYCLVFIKIIITEKIQRFI